MTYRHSTLLIFVLFLLPVISFAHSPTVTIDSIGGVPVTPSGPVINIPFFPYTIEFEGTVTHEGKGGLNQILLYGAVNGEFIYGPESLSGNKKETSVTYSIPWTVERPGVYDIAITATHKQELATEKDICRAAPAIAAAYLKDLRENGEATIEKVIQVVASETGSNGELWAKEKCDPNYETTTLSFITN